MPFFYITSNKKANQWLPLQGRSESDISLPDNQSIGGHVGPALNQTRGSLKKEVSSTQTKLIEARGRAHTIQTESTLVEKWH